MKNGVELRELRRIREDDGRQFVAVDSAGRIGQFGAEGLQNVVVSGLAGFHQFVRNGIGIQNGKSEFVQNGGHRAFAAGDAACKSKLQHGIAQLLRSHQNSDK